jgi:hypothetical protein
MFVVGPANEEREPGWNNAMETVDMYFPDHVEK